MAPTCEHTSPNPFLRVYLTWKNTHSALLNEYYRNFFSESPSQQNVRFTCGSLFNLAM